MTRLARLAKQNALFVALSVLSLVHVGVVAVRAAAGPTPALVTGLAVPSAPSNGLAVALADDEGCRLVVAFDPACPFCDQAAAAQTHRTEPLPYPVEWVGMSPEAAQSFAERHGGLAVRSDAALFSALQVKAVPAAFLMDGPRVVDAWRFTGLEKADDLKARCGGEIGAPLLAGLTPADD